MTAEDYLKYPYTKEGVLKAMKSYAEAEREKAFTYGYAEGFSDNPLNDVEIKLEEYKQQNPLT